MNITKIMLLNALNIMLMSVQCWSAVTETQLNPEEVEKRIEELTDFYINKILEPVRDNICRQQLNGRILSEEEKNALFHRDLAPYGYRELQNYLELQSIDSANPLSIRLIGQEQAKSFMRKFTKDIRGMSREQVAYTMREVNQRTRQKLQEIITIVSEERIRERLR